MQELNTHARKQLFSVSSKKPRCENKINKKGKKENVYTTLTHCGMYLNQTQEADFHSR